MQRRSLLQGAAALPLLTTLPAALWASGPRQRVRPGDPQWPSAAKWRELKRAVGGNLLEVHPLFAACAAAAAPACAEVLKNIRNPFYIGDQAGGTQVSGWLDAWTPAASVYALRARHAADVAAAVNFARRHNLRLVVKGGGHSYLGTSNAPDSLLIWTRAMNQVALHEAFVGAGLCRPGTRSARGEPRRGLHVDAMPTTPSLPVAGVTCRAAGAPRWGSPASFRAAASAASPRPSAPPPRDCWKRRS